MEHPAFEAKAQTESENWEDMNKKYKLQALTTYHNFSTANTRSALNPDDL